MSRSYDMQVTVRRFNPARSQNIEDICCFEFPFESLEIQPFDTEPVMVGTTVGDLYCGESEEEFSERLTKAIWAANDQYCPVTVRLLYLDTLPYDVYELGQNDYQEWVKAAA